MTDRAKLGKKVKARGKAFERWVSRALQEVWPHARRNLQPQGGVKVGGDIANTPFAIECHISGKLSWAGLMSKMRQCAEDESSVCAITGNDTRPPVVIVRKPGDATAYALMPLDDWIELHEKDDD